MIQITGYTDKHEYTNKNGVRSVVYLMDCMDAMAQMPDGAFDLACVDPPYGIGVAKTGLVGGNRLAAATKYKAKQWDNTSPKSDFFDRCMLVSKNQVIWGANHFVSKMPFDSSCWLVWDKDNSGNFADCELAWASFDTAVRKFVWRWNGMLQGDMKNKEDRIHPTQKPVALYDWIFKNYAEPGQSVLDTHLGSGSSRIAADRAGMPFMGFELDPDYFRDHCKRFDNYTAQTTLF